MPINFPNSPSLNQLYNYDNKTWEWNGVYWEVYSALTSYITSAYTVGNGVSDISGVTGGNIALKSFSGININIIDSGNKLTFSGQSTSGLTSGSGTPDTLPKWVSSNSLGDSIVSDNGSTMTVNGDAEINNNYLGSRGGDVTFLFYGYRAGEGIDVSSYSSNLGIGNAVLKNSTGNNNIVIGEGLSEHPTESNISIGFGSYTINTSGQKNVIIGHESFKNNDSGSENISIGYGTLSNNNTGDSNIAIGSNSLNVNLSGDYNIAIGQSLASLESGRRNIAIGEFASRQLFDTDDNISIGIQSLYSNDRGSYNVAIGNFSLLSDTRGGSNVSIGYQSGYSLDGGSGNVFIGFRSAYEFNGGSRLYIHNDSGIPLLYGEFDNRRLGVNITAATNTLHVSGSTNPVRFEGLQFSSNTRYLVANEQGVVTFVTGVTGEKSFNLIAINGVTQLSATTLQRINFSGVNLSINSASTNTLVFSASNPTDRINVDSIFGGGEDGDITIVGSTTTLTRDSFYNTITLGVNGQIQTNSWRLFCKTLIFSGSGAEVQNDGGNGVVAPSGSGGGAGAGASGGGFLSTSQSGTAGANGAATAAGSQSLAVSNLSVSTQFSVSGPSGKGGNTTARTGGIAGATNLVTNIKYISTIPFVDTLLRVTTQVFGGTAGRGGSSGASDSATPGRGGGGGGGGAGAVIVFAETINVTNGISPVFSAKGGNGGNGGSTGVVDTAGGGGGSGGSGGYIIIVYKEIIGSLVNAVDVSGGNGGNGGSGGTSGLAITGGNGGGSGGGGRIVLINVSTGLVTHTVGVNGVAGSAATGTGGAAGATATPVTLNL